MKLSRYSKQETSIDALDCSSYPRICLEYVQCDPHTVGDGIQLERDRTYILNINGIRTEYFMFTPQYRASVAEGLMLSSLTD